MKKALTAILLAGTMPTLAADYRYLTIEKTDGTVISLPAVGLTISYADGDLHAVNGTEKATVTLTDLSRMYFSETKSETTGIINIDAIDQDIEASVYDLHGCKVAEGRLSALKPQLRKGFYLIQQKDKTIKVQIK